MSPPKGQSRPLVRAARIRSSRRTAANDFDHPREIPRLCKTSGIAPKHDASLLPAGQSLCRATPSNRDSRGNAYSAPLNSSLTRRPYTVVWDRCNVRYRFHSQASRVQCPQCALAARARPLDKYLHFTHVKLAHSLPSRRRSRKLGRKRRTLAAPLETSSARTRPTQDCPLGIRYRDNRIVKCCANMDLPARYVLPLPPARSTAPPTLCSRHRFSLTWCSCP